MIKLMLLRLIGKLLYKLMRFRKDEVEPKQWEANYHRSYSNALESQIRCLEAEIRQNQRVIGYLLSEAKIEPTYNNLRSLAVRAWAEDHRRRSE